MSRIGRAPITVPKGVEVNLAAQTIKVKGPKGTLERLIHPAISVSYADGSINVQRHDDNKVNRALHGLTRALINNMVKGVTDGFKKELEITGVGFRADAKPKGVLLTIGFSHGIFVAVPQGIKIEIPKPTTIVISGADAELVGQVAAEIRSLRKPEPYKGKGIRYSDERVTRKAGKTGKAGGK